MRRVRALAFLTAVIVACGSDPAVVTDTTAEPASASTQSPGTVAPPTTRETADFPTRLQGPDGRTLVLSEQPQRIVSLSATHTEMIYAFGAGDQIAATDQTSNYPDEANSTPKVDAFNFNIEEVASLNPDLVILAFDFQGETEALDQLEIPNLLLPPAATLEDMFSQMELLGKAVGRSEDAVRLVTSMEAEIAEILDSVPASEPRLSLYHEVDDTLFTANSLSFLGDIYTKMNLVNIADEVPDEFSSGYVQLSAEFIFESDPDLIFLGDASFGQTVQTVSARPGWNTLTAVQLGHLFELDADIAGRWGPRTIDLIREVAAAIAEVDG